MKLDRHKCTTQSQKTYLVIHYSFNLFQYSIYFTWFLNRVHCFLSQLILNSSNSIHFLQSLHFCAQLFNFYVWQNSTISPLKFKIFIFPISSLNIIHCNSPVKAVAYGHLFQKQLKMISDSIYSSYFELDISSYNKFRQHITFFCVWTPQY